MSKKPVRLSDVRMNHLRSMKKTLHAIFKRAAFKREPKPVCLDDVRMNHLRRMKKTLRAVERKLAAQDKAIARIEHGLATMAVRVSKKVNGI